MLAALLLIAAAPASFTGKTRWRQSGEGLHVVERLTPESGSRIRDDFTVEDASAYTQAWSGRLWITRTTGAIYEYACHEGNYSLAGICAARGPRKATAERAEHAAQGFSAGPAISAVASYPENPTQRPPAPTPNHSISDTSATSFITAGDTRPSPACVTFRRTVSAKMVPSSRQIIFTANGVL